MTEFHLEYCDTELLYRNLHRNKLLSRGRLFRFRYAALGSSKQPAGREQLELLLDVNTTLFPLAVSDKFELALRTTLMLDGSPTPEDFDPSIGSEADDYEYVMHGKVFQCDVLPETRLAFHVSFGGLLMRLTGPASLLSFATLDNFIFLLLRRLP